MMTGACRFMARERILSAHYSVRENVCVCALRADDANREEWQRFSSLDVLFGQSRSG